MPASSTYHRNVFYREWPTFAVVFFFPQNEEDLTAVRWLPLEEAHALPNLLTDGTRRDLTLFRQRLGLS